MIQPSSSKGETVQTPSCILTVRSWVAVPDAEMEGPWRRVWLMSRAQVTRVDAEAHGG